MKSPLDLPRFATGAELRGPGPGPGHGSVPNGSHVGATWAERAKGTNRTNRDLLLFSHRLGPTCIVYIYDMIYDIYIYIFNIIYIMYLQCFFTFVVFEVGCFRGLLQPFQSR
jgi:hypothetical protein